MAVQIVQSTSVNNSTSLTLTTTAVSGNILLFFAGHFNATAVTPPTGFVNKIVDQDNINTGLSIYYKISDGTEKTLTYTGNSSDQASLIEISGGNTTNPFEFTVANYTTPSGVTSQLSPLYFPRAVGSIPGIFFALYDSSNSENAINPPFDTGWINVGPDGAPANMIASSGYRNTAVTSSDITNGYQTNIRFSSPGAPVNWVVVIGEILPAGSGFNVPASITGYTETDSNSGILTQSTPSPFKLSVLPVNAVTGVDFTVTPSDNGAGGVFTPSNIILGSASTDKSAYFSYKPSSTATNVTISYTNTGGFSNPANQSFTVNPYVGVKLVQSKNSNSVLPSLNVPPTAGNLLVLFVSDFNGVIAKSTTPTGFVELVNDDYINTGFSIYLKTSDGSEQNVIVPQFEDGGHYTITYAEYSGQDLGNTPIEFNIAAYTNAVGVTSQLSPTLYPSRVGSLPLVFYAVFDEIGNASANNPAFPVGWSDFGAASTGGGSNLLASSGYRNTLVQTSDITNGISVDTTIYDYTSTSYPAPLNWLIAVAAVKSFDSTVIPVTGYTVSAPVSSIYQTVISNAFHVLTTPLNANSGSSFQVVPSDNGAGGTFSPTSVTLSGATGYAEFTYTNSVAENVSFSFTNSGGFSDSAPFSIQIQNYPVFTETDYSSSVDIIVECTGPDGRIWYSGTNLSNGGSIVAITSTGVSTTYAKIAGNYQGNINPGPISSSTLWYSARQFGQSDNYYAVNIIDTSGNNIANFFPSSGATVVNDVSNMVQDPDGVHMWFILSIRTSSGTSYGFVQMDATGTYTSYPFTAFTTATGGAYSICTDGQGNYFATDGYQSFFKCTSNGTITSYTNSNLSGTFGVVYAPDGNIWYSGEAFGYIINFGYITHQGVFSPFYLTSYNYEFMYNIVVGPDGALWGATTKDFLFRCDVLGNVTRFTVPNLLSNGTSLAGGLLVAGPNKTLWTSSYANSGPYYAIKLAFPSTQIINAASTYSSSVSDYLNTSLDLNRILPETLAGSSNLNRYTNVSRIEGDTLNTSGAPTYSFVKFLPITVNPNLPCTFSVQGFILPDSNIPYESIITVIEDPKIAEGYKQTLRNKP